MRVGWLVMLCLVMAACYLLWLVVSDAGGREPKGDSPDGPPFDAAAIERRRDRDLADPDRVIRTLPFTADKLYVAVETADGRRVSKAQVLAYRADDRLGDRPLGQGMTDDRGEVVLEGIEQTRVHILAISENHGAGELISETSPTRSAVVVVLDRGGEIRGRVLAWDGRALPGVEVEIRGGPGLATGAWGLSPVSFRWVRRVAPDEDGYFLVTGLDASREFWVSFRHPTHLAVPMEPKIVKPDQGPIRVFMFPIFGRWIRVIDGDVGAPTVFPVIETRVSYMPNVGSPIERSVPAPWRFFLKGSRAYRGEDNLPERHGNEHLIMYLCRIPQEEVATAKVARRLSVQIPGYEALEVGCELLPIAEMVEHDLAVRMHPSTGTQAVRFQVEGGFAAGHRVSLGLAKKKNGPTFRIGHTTFDERGLSEIVRVRAGRYFISGNYGFNGTPPILVEDKVEGVQVIPIEFRRGGDVFIQPRIDGGAPAAFARLIRFKGLDPETQVWDLEGVTLGPRGFFEFNIAPGRYMAKVGGAGTQVVSTTLLVRPGEQCTWEPVLRE